MPADLVVRDLSRPAGAARLVLMRHAKSDYPLGVADHDRPLNDRGRMDARAAGQWLQSQGSELLGQAPLVLVSSALRTQQTWQIAGAACPLTTSPSTEPRLYEANDRAYLEVLHEGLLQADTVVVVGHNPSTQEAACSIAADSGGVDYLAMSRKYPTSGIAVIDLPQRQLGFGTGFLVAFVIPRGPTPSGEGRPAGTA